MPSKSSLFDSLALVFLQTREGNIPTRQQEQGKANCIDPAIPAPGMLEPTPILDTCGGMSAGLLGAGKEARSQIRQVILDEADKTSRLDSLPMISKG
jgi:hypothetical protein